jgi:hypothetical protein
MPSTLRKNQQKESFSTKLSADQRDNLVVATELEAARLQRDNLTKGEVLRTAAFFGPSIHDILRRHGRTPKGVPALSAESAS